MHMYTTVGYPPSLRHTAVSLFVRLRVKELELEHVYAGRACSMMHAHVYTGRPSGVRRPIKA